jgi:hypothetical protein
MEWSERWRVALLECEFIFYLDGFATHSSSAEIAHDDLSKWSGEVALLAFTKGYPIGVPLTVFGSVRKVRCLLVTVGKIAPRARLAAPTSK